MSTFAHGSASGELTGAAGPQAVAGDDAPRGPAFTGTVSPAVPILSFDEIVDLYPGEWILLRVTAVEGGWPSHGEVVAHHASRTTITDAWADVVRAKRPEDRYHVFRACHSISTGAELREGLAVLQETWDEDLREIWEDEVGLAWRRW